MPYPFPVQRFREFQTWVPETDIDGTDAKASIFSKVENIDFENGFIKNTASPITYDLPVSIQLEVLNNYEIISSRFFRHSERGDCEFYVLYKLSGSDHLLKFFVYEVDTDTAIEVNPDEQNSNITYASKPANISYNIVNDQLKCNLNINATYTTLSETVIFNLTVVYLDTVTYDAATDYVRSAGWYVFPRWLGWTFSGITMGSDTELVEDFDDGTYETWLSFYTPTSSWAYNATPLNANITSTGSTSYANSSGGEVLVSMEISNIRALQTLKFELADAYQDTELTVRISGWSGTGTVPPEDLLIYSSTTGGKGFSDQSIDVNIIPKWADVTGVNITVYIVVPDSKTFEIGNVRLEAFNNVVLVAKNFDQQRAMLLDDGILDILTDTNIVITKSQMDWRVSSYEIYFPESSTGSSINYLIAKFDLEADTPPTWTDGGATLTVAFSSGIIDTTANDYAVETLNFNYGLGASVSVNNQKVIYDEVLYRGRVYFVKGDEKLYMSHISGTSLTQPDSFPYNEDTSFGYLITSQVAENRSLAVTPLDELVINSKTTNYVYIIQETGGVPLRIIKAINGSHGIASINSMVKELNGQPSAPFLAWANTFGAFIYGGGRNQPENITDKTHKNYWLAITASYKEGIVAFFNKGKNEIWFQVNNEIIVYETTTGAFKKHKLGFTIKEYLGERDNIIYLLTTAGTIKKVDPTYRGTLNAVVETHYMTDTIIIGQYPISAWEWQHKILQDLYVIFKDHTNGAITLEVIADENEIDPEIRIYTGQLREVVPSPLLVRYGKVKLRLTIPKTLTKIKEFGYSFSIPSQGRGGLISTAVQGIGQTSGLSAGIGL